MDDEEDDVELGRHPKGTLAIVGVFGVLFVIGWLYFYFVVFASRGHVH